MSNSFDPDQDRHSVGPDLSPNCLQRLSADVKIAASKERVNAQARIGSFRTLQGKQEQLTTLERKKWTQNRLLL